MRLAISVLALLAMVLTACNPKEAEHSADLDKTWSEGGVELRLTQVDVMTNEQLLAAEDIVHGAGEGETFLRIHAEISNDHGDVIGWQFPEAGDEAVVGRESYSWHGFRACGDTIGDTEFRDGTDAEGVFCVPLNMSVEEVVEEGQATLYLSEPNTEDPGFEVERDGFEMPISW